MIETAQVPLPPASLKHLAETVGPLPSGDTPVAWYMSLHPEVLAKYEEWRIANAAWRDRITELFLVSGFDPATTRIAHFDDHTMVGVYVPELKTHTWWRQEKAGHWVPRKRTKAEKGSEVSQRFAASRRIPHVLRYVPGMPHSVWIDGIESTTVYPVKLRRAPGPGPDKGGTAVLAFLGVDPNAASNPPFEVGPQWSRMKLSLYHALRERQEEVFGG